jgi:hypothetical protein
MSAPMSLWKGYSMLLRQHLPMDKEGSKEYKGPLTRLPLV